MESHYGCPGISLDGQQRVLRSWADTRRSSRVFNESKAALMLTLQDIEKRGIKHVVLLGDYTDDGQIEATDRLIDILRQHRKQFGTSFYAITGNHDAYGLQGKHQSTRFVSSAGETVLVTSDPKVAATEPESAVLTPGMYCEGVADGITKMSDFGLFQRPEYVHWETPFGVNDALDARRYDARSEDGLTTHQLVDASYLVEPVEGLWLLMIDANVFEPRNGQWTPSQKKAFLDSSDAGWNSVLKNRPHLIQWIVEVCARAEQTGKTLIAFSHYPIIDPFADTANSAMKLFGDHEMLRRKPEKSVSEKLLHSGLRMHFSGHLHVSALSQQSLDSQVLEDCAVPSLVAFPACYKVVHTNTDSLHIDSVQLSSMPLDQSLLTYYRKESTESGDAATTALEASNYGDFLYQRMFTRVVHHYLNKEWPANIAHSIRHTTAADLALYMYSDAVETDNVDLTQQTKTAAPELLVRIEPTMADYGLNMKKLATCSMTRLVSDWYCLRHAGPVARRFMESENLVIYQYLSDSFGDLKPEDATTPKAFFTLLLGMLNTALQRSTPENTRERTLSA